MGMVEAGRADGCDRALMRAVGGFGALLLAALHCNGVLNLAAT